MMAKTKAKRPSNHVRSKQRSTPERDIIVVLGMHRSGTSGVSGVLCKIGGGAPKTLYGAFPSNLMGHWESEPIFRFNDKLLAARHRHWNEWRVVPGMEPVPVFTDAEMDEAVSILDSEYGNVRFPVVKDPRMCRLMPFWREAFRRWGGRVHLVMPTRSPLEVAQSMQARALDKMPLIAGLHMWLGHVLLSERYTRGQPRLLFHWDHFMTQWRDVVGALRSATDNAFPDCDEAARSEIDAFLRPDLRHHQHDFATLRASPDVHPWIIDVYEAMGTLQTREDPTIHARLDALFVQFEATSDHFSRYQDVYLQVFDRAKRLEVVEAELSSERAVIDIKDRHIALLKAANDEYDTLTDDYNKKITDLYAQIGLEKKKTAEFDTLTQKVIYLETGISFLQKAIEDYKSNVDQLNVIAAGYVRDIEKLYRQLENANSVNESLKNREKEIVTARKMIANLEKGLSDYKSHAQVTQALNEQYAREIDILYKKLGEATVSQSVLSNREAELAVTREAINNLEQSLEGHTQHFAQAEELIEHYAGEITLLHQRLEEALRQQQTLLETTGELEIARRKNDALEKSLTAYATSYRAAEVLVARYAAEIGQLHEQLAEARSIGERLSQSEVKLAAAQAEAAQHAALQLVQKEAISDWKTLCEDYRQQILDLYAQLERQATASANKRS